jgi:predicted nucleic acid-binding protein
MRRLLRTRTAQPPTLRPASPIQAVFVKPKQEYSGLRSNRGQVSALVILPFDELAGRCFGALKAELESMGEPLDDLDLQIASIAIGTNSLLLTNNTKHFKRISGLRLINWLE